MTTSSVLGQIYAQAVYDIASQDGSQVAVGDELRAVVDVIDGLDADLRAFIAAPIVNPSDKWTVLEAAFQGKVSRTVLGLLRVLVDRRREPLLDNIVTEYGLLIDNAAGRIRVEVVTARPIDDELAEALRVAIVRQTNADIVLDQQIDPTLIGGIRISLGDLVVDGTTRRALRDLRRSLTTSLV